METAAKIIRQVIELRIGESELTFTTESSVGRDRQGLAGAAPNINEQGFCGPISVGTGREQSIVQYPRASGTSAGFLGSKSWAHGTRMKTATLTCSQAQVW